MTTDRIETPAVIIDEAVAQANIAAYQAYCSNNGLKLRPHIKTHKLPYFAKAQIAAGATGINCQKVGEAEVMAQAGISDILITFNILGEAKLNRLRAIGDRVKKLSVTADSAVTIDGLASRFSDAAMPLFVLVECDTGAQRCGVQTPQAALALAQQVVNAPGLCFGGLLTYPPVGGAARVDKFMREAKTLLADNDIECPEISSGGSPDMWHARQTTTATEYRVGTYIYNDRSLVERGTCTWADCALSILATVVSTPIPERAIIDAGSKALSSDLLGLQGHGHVVGHPNANIVALSEEHGIIHATPNEFSVGDRISIVPNHVCVVSNLFDYAWLKAADGTIGKIRIDARGAVV